MAKVSYTKLNLKTDDFIYNYTINDMVIEVKSYLPVEDKNKLIQNVLNLSVNDMGYYNITLLKVNIAVEVLMAYTNINFTEKQKENYFKIYDAFASTGHLNNIFDLIPEEIAIITNGALSQIENVYAFRNSAAGIMEAIGSDYSALNMNVDELQSKIANKENLEFLKDVMDKLG